MFFAFWGVGEDGGRIRQLKKFVIPDLNYRFLTTKKLKNLKIIINKDHFALTTQDRGMQNFLWTVHCSCQNNISPV